MTVARLYASGSLTNATMSSLVKTQPPISKEIGEFWNGTSGFDYTSFTEVYKERRRRQGKTQKSKTRTRFDRFWDNGFKSVETNVCSEVDVEKSDKECYCNSTVLRILWDNMPRQPKIGVFAHGGPATDFINNYQLSMPRQFVCSQDASFTLTR